MAGKESKDDLFGMFETMFGSAGMPNSSTMFDTMMLSLLQLLRKNLSEFDGQLKIYIDGISVGKSYNPFDILGVDTNATEEEITSAYREKAKKLHPDVGGSNAKMQELNAAYEVIMRVKGWKQ